MRRLLDSDIAWRFRRSPLAIAALAVTLLMMAGAVLAPLIAPQDPFDPANLDLMNSLIPPAFEAQGDAQFPLGTDDQGRDLLSAILYGTRISLLVGFAGVALAMLIGVTLGLIAGYRGGWAGALIMRIADVQLTFPAILIALLINGVALAVVGRGGGTDMQIGVIIVAIGLSYWVQYARTVRGSTLVESRKEYVLAARLIGLSDWTIMFRHVLPNVTGPVLVIATINLALAIITEATLSFLGVGVPPTSPSLGTLISIGNRFLFSGEWWITIFPGLALAILALAVNLLGDWLRDALNPKLR
ncbi:peptide/nickel transport system permease protein [Inquilinus ginsengisoli]|uniref:Peptide/nickel transport system permease protein n=1 Tax=Inquilinus ginsengisoli TaxID=363840 RepID=A0ABU1JLT3_9PROT|nr:ABC transporter permease [Inquilinus ginsengisoli]MDR6289298.1 peptide/nickel transport system permease protein [Inquilinus ginsengisoli]